MSWSPSTVAVLGAGPAGLMAAQAVTLAGRPLALFSGSKEQSRLGGAQFLHQPIPDINDIDVPDTIVTYRVEGDERTYREKVYGSERVPFVSFSGVTDGQQQPAWNLSRTYDALWEKFWRDINVTEITPEWIDAHLGHFDLIFSTVPAPALCRIRAGLQEGRHSFRVQDIHIATEKFVNDCPPDTVIYDGTNDHSWYRASQLFGHHGCEWSDQHDPPVPNLIHDRKPISTTCDCYINQVLRLGRRGTWKKGVLTHDAFYDAIKVFVG